MKRSYDGRDRDRENVRDRDGYSHRESHRESSSKRRGGIGHGQGHGHGNSDRDRRQISPEEGEILMPSASATTTSSSSSKHPKVATRDLEPMKEAEEEDIDYDALYTSSLQAKSATVPQKTAAELLEDKKRKRAAILAKYQQRLSVTPQPEPGPSTITTSTIASAANSNPGTPLGITTGLQSAVRKLAVQSTATTAAAAAGSEGTASPDVARSARGAGSPMRQDGDEEDEEGELSCKRHENDLLMVDLARKDGEEPISTVDKEAKPATTSGTSAATTRKEENQIYAADYNPEEEDDRMNDDRRERERIFLDSAAHETADQSKVSTATHTTSVDKRPLEQVVPVSVPDDEDEEDDGDDDDDDMFVVKKKKKPRLNKSQLGAVERELEEGSRAGANSGAAKVAYVPIINRSGDNPLSASQDSSAAPLIVDNFDDPEGYYRVILGETLDNGRYHVHANLGKGMFSNVVRARDLHYSGAAGNAIGEGKGKEKEIAGGSENEQKVIREVAIKIVRSQESMYRAGQKEANILRRLMEADPTDKKHIIRLERTFEHRGHLCLVFESLSMNLRDVVKRFGKDVGINLKAVRAYAHQIFLAMNLLKKLNIMHADIKPDNILVNESKSVLKVCDLGSASNESEAEITPYLVSRFYRAPEIILGLPYDCSLDMWSIGCTLYELYTGKILFPGRSNNHMLLLAQELKGRYPGRLVKKAKFGEIHFEESNFVSVERNKTSGADIIKKIVIPPKAASDLRARLMPPATLKRMQEDEIRLLTNFVNLLDRSLELDPAKRLTPKEALNHPFLR